MKYDEINVYVPISVYQNEELYDLDISVYIFCKMLGMISPTHISISTISYYMFNDRDMKKRERIKESLLHLIELGCLNGKRIAKDEYVICDLDAMPQEEFAIINIEDIQRIIQSSYKKRYAMVRYWCYVMKSLNGYLTFEGKSRFLGFQKISYFCNVCNKAKSTIIRYNQELEDIGVLYVVHVRSKDPKQHNYYSRYADREIVDNYLKIQYNNIN